jgi:hypothetical protein
MVHDGDGRRLNELRYILDPSDHISPMSNQIKTSAFVDSVLVAKMWTIIGIRIGVS